MGTLGKRIRAASFHESTYRTPRSAKRKPGRIPEEDKSADKRELSGNLVDLYRMGGGGQSSHFMASSYSCIGWLGIYRKDSSATNRDALRNAIFDMCTFWGVRLGGSDVLRLTAPL